MAKKAKGNRVSLRNYKEP